MKGIHAIMLNKLNFKNCARCPIWNSLNRPDHCAAITNAGLRACCNPPSSSIPKPLPPSCRGPHHGTQFTITVTINLTGGWNGDLYAHLVHESGFSVLLNRTGRSLADPDGSGSLRHGHLA